MKQTQKNKVLAFAIAALVAVSSAPVPAIAAEPTLAVSTASTEAVAINGMVYGTVNMSYADFYYGELNDISTVTENTPLLEAADPVNAAGYTGAGQYDAVSSATTSKSKRFETTYFEDVATGVNILGIGQVQIAIPEELYQNTKAAIDAGKTCSNKLFDYVKNMTFSSQAFSEYKVLKADGTFSKMVSDTKEVTDAKAEITTDTRWGNYQINISNIDVANGQMLGVILETSDGKKYGMKHLENLWLKTAEMSFAVEPMTEPHGNTLTYQRYSDIQGKTISKITYLIKDGADLVIPTNLFVKYLLSDQYKLTASDVVTASGNLSSNIRLTSPADASYQISSLKFNNTVVDASLYSYTNGVLTLNESCKPGTYTVTFTDNKYEDISTTFTVVSKLEQKDLSISNNTLAIEGNAATLSEYINAITAVSVDGKNISGQNLGTAIFNEDGTINFAASISNRGTTTTVFANGADGDYTLSITAAGYPSIEAKVGKSYVIIPASSLQIGLNKTEFTYNGKAQKPSVTVKNSSGAAISADNYTLSYSADSKLPGAYSVTVDFKNQYSGSRTLSYTIKPAKITLKVGSATKNTVKLSWKKAAGITGYQIQYSTSPKFKSVKKVSVNAKKTSTTLKKLTKNKKYYVRIRSYKKATVNNKSTSLYSSWSAVKNVKTKK